MLPFIILPAAAVLVYLYLILPRPRAWRKAPRKRMLFAHRGLWQGQENGPQSVPENSMAAFRAAVERGFGIETDVQLSRDGHLILFHDDTLQRMCGDPRAVCDVPYAEMRAMHLMGTKETLPDPAMLLKLTDGRVPLLLEIKTGRRIPELCEKLCALLDTYRGFYMIESFDPRALWWFRRHRPKVLRGQLAFGLTRGAKWKKTGLNRALSSLVQNVLGRPAFMALDADTDKAFALRAVRLFRPGLAAWTVRSQREADALSGRYDMIIFEGFVPDNKNENGLKSKTNGGNAV